MPDPRRNDDNAAPRKDRDGDDRGESGRRNSERQVDDNQDDLGRDVNDPRRIGNEINRRGH